MAYARPTARRRRGVGPWVVLVAVIVLVGIVVMAVRALTSGAETPEEVTVEQLEPEPVTPPLSFDGFKAARIIEDDQFFDVDALTEEQIQAFLDEWNAGCREGADGTACVSEYTEDSPSYEADQYCPGGFTGRTGDTVASIVWKAAQGCGINPKVLLTTLQKEQGLITASGSRLNEMRYTIAMGYACPDDENCDPTYFGFANQVYHAARQFRVYEQNPEMFMVAAEREDFIPYGPGEECGGSSVYVENQATANLYNYTPYQPDEAALNGYSGACSAVGNLNFYAYFNAWFGEQ